MPRGKIIDEETFAYVKNLLALGVKQKYIAKLAQKNNIFISECTVSRINTASSYEDYRGKAITKNNTGNSDKQEGKKDESFQRFIGLQVDKLNQQMTMMNEILVEIRDMLK